MNPKNYRKSGPGGPIRSNSNVKKAYDAKVHRNWNRPYKRPRTLQIPREIKCLDIPDGQLTLNSTGAVGAINLMRAGSSYFNRIGRKINMKSVRVNFYLVPIRAVTNIDYARVLLIYDRQCNGALPALSDILQTTDQAGTNTTGNMSNANLNNRDRFKILRDQRITLPGIPAGGPPWEPTHMFDAVTPTTNVEWFVKLGGLETQFKADSSPAVIGDIATGSLLLLTLGDFAAGSEGYAIQIETRLRYWDV